MAKRKPEPDPPKPAAPVIAEAILERVVARLVTVRSRAQVFAECLENDEFSLEPAQARAAIDEALRRIRVAAAFDLDAELGASKTRLLEIYQASVDHADLRTALRAQRELNLLMALHGRDSSPESEGADTADVIDQLAKARGHLAPLVAGSDDEPLDEIARRVALLFTTRPSVRAK